MCSMLTPAPAVNIEAGLSDAVVKRPDASIRTARPDARRDDTSSRPGTRDSHARAEAEWALVPG